MMLRLKLVLSLFICGTSQIIAGCAVRIPESLATVQPAGACVFKWSQDAATDIKFAELGDHPLLAKNLSPPQRAAFQSGRIGVLKIAGTLTRRGCPHPSSTGDGEFACNGPDFDIEVGLRGAAGTNVDVDVETTFQETNHGDTIVRHIDSKRLFTGTSPIPPGGVIPDSFHLRLRAGGGCVKWWIYAPKVDEVVWFDGTLRHWRGPAYLKDYYSNKGEFDTSGENVRTLLTNAAHLVQDASWSAVVFGDGPDGKDDTRVGFRLEIGSIYILYEK